MVKPANGLSDGQTSSGDSSTLPTSDKKKKKLEKKEKNDEKEEGREGQAIEGGGNLFLYFFFSEKYMRSLKRD